MMSLLVLLHVSLSDPAPFYWAEPLITAGRPAPFRLQTPVHRLRERERERETEKDRDRDRDREVERERESELTLVSKATSHTEHLVHSMQELYGQEEDRGGVRITGLVTVGTAHRTPRGCDGGCSSVGLRGSCSFLACRVVTPGPP